MIFDKILLVDTRYMHIFIVLLSAIGLLTLVMIIIIVILPVAILLHKSRGWYIKN